MSDSPDKPPVSGGASDASDARDGRSGRDPGPSPSERTLTLRRPVQPPPRVVAITGAASFLGSALLTRLEADPRCRKVLALDIQRPRHLGGKTQFHHVDLTLPAVDQELAALLGRERVDTVVHAAFLSAPTHNQTFVHELESVGTMHVLSAAAQVRARKLVLLSSTLLYGALPQNPNFLTEQHEPKGHPRSRFINEKLDAERQTRRYADENPDTVVTILRAAPMLGPTIRNYFTRFLARPVAPVLMGYDPLLQTLHEEDLVDAFEIAVSEDHPGIYNIVGDGVLPYTTVLAMLGRVPLPMPASLAYPLSRTLWMTQIFDSPPSFLDFLRFLCVADGSKARREMGFHPRWDIRGALHDFLGLGAGPTPGGPAHDPEARRF